MFLYTCVTFALLVVNVHFELYRTDNLLPVYYECECVYV